MTETPNDATPREPYRRFSADDGSDWLVWLLADDAVRLIREPPSLGRAWLMFLGPNGETRRLAPFPAQWRQMSDAQLYALALQATVLSAHRHP